MNLIKLALAAEQMALAKDRPPVLVKPDRCIHTTDKSSDCNACVQGCPTDAISLKGKGGVNITAERCIQCGLCLHQCPVGVFSGVDGVGKLLRCAAQITDRERLELACVHHPDPAPGDRKIDGVLCSIGCLTSLGASSYLGLLALDVQELHVRLDACAECPVGALRPSIEKVIDSAREILKTQGQEERLQIRDSLDDIRWKRSRPVYNASRPPLSRRGFFQMMTLQNKTEADDILPASGEQIVGKKSPPLERRRLLGALRHLNVPDMQQEMPQDQGFTQLTISETCTACGICERVCPTKALHLETTEDSYRLGFSAGDCTACGICVTLCEPQAITFDGVPIWDDVVDPRPVVKHKGKLNLCKRCGVPYATESEHGLCPVCEFRRKNPFGSHIPEAVMEQMKKNGKSGESQDQQ